MAATMTYTEAQLGQSNAGKVPSGPNNDPGVQPSETDGDALSTTLTIQTGFSSSYHPNTLPLSRLSKHSIKLKASSSFPNLLSLYQAPIREESTLEKPQKKPKRHRRERRKKEEKPDNEEHQERRNTLEARRLRIDAVARDQLEKFDNYVTSMKHKVDKQREERRKYNEILQERFREQEENERKKLRLHRGPKHRYIHDTSFMKTLPVSNFCKATRLADELQRKGVLRTRGDVEKYWGGFAERQRANQDIFADDSSTSVNYPNQWMGMRKPEIRIESEEDQLTEATALRQLPPLKKRKKKKKSRLNDEG